MNYFCKICHQPMYFRRNLSDNKHTYRSGELGYLAEQVMACPCEKYWLWLGKDNAICVEWITLDGNKCKGVIFDFINKQIEIVMPDTANKKMEIIPELTVELAQEWYRRLKIWTVFR